jgi:hypothetical protein
MTSHPSGIRSLCLHHPHLNDVWMSGVLPFLLPSMSPTRVLFCLLRYEFRARIDRVVNERVYLDRSSQRCTVGFLPSTFPYYNTYCAYITKDWEGNEMSFYDLTRVNDNGEDCGLTRYIDFSDGERVPSLIITYGDRS